MLTEVLKLSRSTVG